MQIKPSRLPMKLVDSENRACFACLFTDSYSLPALNLQPKILQCRSTDPAHPESRTRTIASPLVPVQWFRLPFVIWAIGKYLGLASYGCKKKAVLPLAPLIIVSAPGLTQLCRWSEWQMLPGHRGHLLSQRPAGARLVYPATPTAALAEEPDWSGPRILFAPRWCPGKNGKMP